MTDEEISIKEPARDNTNTGQLLSVIQHIIESSENEILVNLALKEELLLIKGKYPDYWDKLYELHDQFASYKCDIKEKARVD